MFKFKSCLGNKQRVLASYPVPFVEQLFKEKKIVSLHGYEISIVRDVYNSHFSRKHLITKSKKCAICGIEGNVFVLEQRKTLPPAFVLYHKTEDGKFILMTADHIVPRALGGGKRPDNLQTCCTTCNNKKQDLLIFDFLTKDHISKFHIKLRKTISLDGFIKSHNISVTYN